ncbi:MAG: ThuA domain-containing protein [Clostridia bacterium]|nr:ThuA domain-containing protein [Clostridia bacterium]
MLRVTIWNEYHHEQHHPIANELYPEGIHGQLASFLKDEFEVRTALLSDDECGLTEEVLKNTDVLIWWGHVRHYAVPDRIVERVCNAVASGMGLIALHSTHQSKIFHRLMGTPCNLSWRENGDKVRNWVCDPSHPIAKGIDRYFELEHEETYCEPFSIPEPMETVFIGWYEGGECFRTGVTFKRGHGKIFYFQPGHETYPTYYNKDVQLVIKNAINWAAPIYRDDDILECHRINKTY